MMTDGHGHVWRLGGIRCEQCQAYRFSRDSSKQCPRTLPATPAFDTDTDLDVTPTRDVRIDSDTSAYDTIAPSLSNFSLPDPPAEAPCDTSSYDSGSSSDFASGSCDTSSFDGGFSGGDSGGGGGGSDF